MGRAEDIFEEIVERGMDALEAFILNHKSEELFLDYKRSANNGDGDTLNSSDWKNLSKAISGFGNSEGGVLVWGVSCGKVKERGDVPDALHPVIDVRRFVSLLEGAVSGCTVPPHTGVRSHAIISDGEDGFAITLIPKSLNTPHQSIQNIQYYIRAGSSFSPTPHAVLQGMFGRRPQPQIFSMYSIFPSKVVGEEVISTLAIQIANAGPGIASDLYINVTFLRVPGPNCGAFIERRQPDLWRGEFFAGRRMTAIAESNLRLGPEQSIHPFLVTVRMRPPFEDPLIIDGMCGSGQSSAYKFRIETDGDSIQRAYEDAQKRYVENGHQELNARDGLDITQQIFETDTEAEREPVKPDEKPKKTYQMVDFEKHDETE